MTALRQCRMTDLLHMSLCNLDPLTENYDVHFYIEYMARWPSLFTVAENSDGQIIGYSELCRSQSSSLAPGLISAHLSYGQS